MVEARVGLDGYEWREMGKMTHVDAAASCASRSGFSSVTIETRDSRNPNAVFQHEVELECKYRVKPLRGDDD